MNPGGYSPEGSMVGVVVPWRTFESAEKYGRALAEAALAVHRGLDPASVERVWGASEIVGAGAQAAPGPGGRTPGGRPGDRRGRGRPGGRPLARTPRTTPSSRRPMPTSSPARPQQPGSDGPVRVRISGLGFGPFVHVGVQGELFVALGQRIRAALGDDTTCIAALCDGTVGYIPTADGLRGGRLRAERERPPERRGREACRGR